MKRTSKNELVEIIAAKPKMPEKWDFGTADKEFDRHIRSWRRLKIDVLSELWVFYNKLSRKEGYRPKKTITNVTVCPTWRQWLERKSPANAGLLPGPRSFFLSRHIGGQFYIAKTFFIFSKKPLDKRPAGSIIPACSERIRQSELAHRSPSLAVYGHSRSTASVGHFSERGRLWQQSTFTKSVISTCLRRFYGFLPTRFSFLLCAVALSRGIVIIGLA